MLFVGNLPIIADFINNNNYIYNAIYNIKH